MSAFSAGLDAQWNALKRMITDYKAKTYSKNKNKMETIHNSKQENNVNKGLTSVVFLQHVHPEVSS